MVMADRAECVMLNKGPDTVGELGRVENCAAPMASLKRRTPRDAKKKGWLGRAEIGSPTVSDPSLCRL